MKMNYILTNGTEYVMENEAKPNDWIRTTYPVKAKHFTYNQAKTMLRIRGKRYSWIRSFHMLDVSTGKVDKNAKYTKGNGGAYIDENDIRFDYDIVNQIYNETKSIMGLAGWNINQLKEYEENLMIGLSKYDSVESDIKHALQKYREDNNGKKPQAHKIAKIGYLLEDIRDKRKNVKQCIAYIKVMEDAVTYGYTIEKLKKEIDSAKFAEYKARTEYYQIALDILS